MPVHSKIAKTQVDGLIDPLTVLNNGFELLKHRFAGTMDSYALTEFERIERALEKINEQIAHIRKQSSETNQ